jgi:hypothetical protein
LKYIAYPCAKRGEKQHDCITNPANCELRFCWIKADPTFEGLKQVLYEPVERVFIGDHPPQLKNDYQIIDTIQITQAAGWFELVAIPLNRDLVAIIGPRGSGKSALAEIIAFAGGASVFKDSTDSPTVRPLDAPQTLRATPAAAEVSLSTLRI